MNGIECALVGVVGVTPELKTSKAGKPWCALSVRVGDGEAAQWLRVAAFGEMADVAAGLAKGASVYVEGRIKLDTWQTKDGEARAGLGVAASLVQPLGRIGRRRPTTSPAASGTAARDRKQAGTAGRAPRSRLGDGVSAGSALDEPLPF